MALTNIFDFKCLKYVKFVRFSNLQEGKIMKKIAIHTQTFAIERHQFRFSLRDLVLHIRFHMFKICEIRSFFNVAGT